MRELLSPKFRGRPESLGRVLLTGAGANLGVTVAGQAVALGLQLLLARWLGAQEYGVYTYSLMIVTLAALLGRLGTDTALVRFVAHYRREDELGLLRGILSWGDRQVLAVTAGAAGMAAIGLWALGSHLESALRETLLWGCALLPPLALLGLRTGALRGLRRVALGLVPDLLLRPLALALLMTVAVFGWSLSPEAPLTMALAVAAAVLALGCSDRWLRRSLPSGCREAVADFRGEEWRRVSRPLLLVAGLRRILQQTDILVIGVLLGTTSAGIYAVATRLSRVVALGLGAVNSITAPLISELHGSGKKEQLQRTITRAAWGASLVSIPACLVLILGRDFFLGLFGSEFPLAGASLIFLCIAQMANALTGPVGWLLNMTGHQEVNARILAWITGLNVVLNIPAVWFWGIEGAAVVTALLSAYNNLWTWAVVRRRLGVDASILSTWR